MIIEINEKVPVFFLLLVQILSNDTTQTKCFRSHVSVQTHFVIFKFNSQTKHPFTGCCRWMGSGEWVRLDTLFEYRRDRTEYALPDLNLWIYVVAFKFVVLLKETSNNTISTLNHDVT